jgi:outer membrane beta-barrel protein
MKLKFVLSLFTILFCTLTLASEKSVYDFSWLDKDKEIYVLQNRKFRKKNKFQVSASVGTTTGRAYVKGTSLQGRATYFFKEDFGVEAVVAVNDGDFNDLANKVRAQNAIPFTRIVDGYKGANLIWSPFYSKINIFDQIIYYDWMFTAGYYSIDTTDNRNEFLVGGGSTYTPASETSTGFQIGTSLLFHITQSIGVRLDVSQIRFEADFYKSKTDTEKFWFKNTDVSVGFNYSF